MTLCSLIAAAMLTTTPEWPTHGVEPIAAQESSDSERGLLRRLRDRLFHDSQARAHSQGSSIATDDPPELVTPSRLTRLRKSLAKLRLRSSGETAAEELPSEAADVITQTSGESSLVLRPTGELLKGHAPDVVGSGSLTSPNSTVRNRSTSYGPDWPSERAVQARSASNSEDLPYVRAASFEEPSSRRSSRSNDAIDTPSLRRARREAEPRAVSDFFPRQPFADEIPTTGPGRASHETQRLAVAASVANQTSLNAEAERIGRVTADQELVASSDVGEVDGLDRGASATDSIVHGLGRATWFDRFRDSRQQTAAAILVIGAIATLVFARSGKSPNRESSGHSPEPVAERGRCQFVPGEVAVSRGRAAVGSVYQLSDSVSWTGSEGRWVAMLPGGGVVRDRASGDGPDGYIQVSGDAADGEVTGSRL